MKGRNKVILLAFILLIICLVKIPDKYHHYDLRETVDKKDKIITSVHNHKSLNAFRNMDLYLRMTSVDPASVQLYERVLIQSMRYFWPDINSTMLVVLDQEKSEDHVYGNTIGKIFPFPRICYMDSLSAPGYSGKDRMQRDMFYPERCTSKKYVAFVDTDTMFATRIIPESLFRQNKPIVIALYGPERTPIFREVASGTAELYKSKEYIRCMTNFPIIYKTEHIIEARHYLEKLHNMPFDDVIGQMKSERFSQFNIMCQYIWMFHRSEYDFHLQLQNRQTKSKVSYRVSVSDMSKNITEEQRIPVPRPCVHFKHTNIDWYKEETYKDLFRSSICFEGGFELCPDICKRYNQTSLRKYMFEFNRIDWSWDQRCMEAQKNHYKTLAKYDSKEYSDGIMKACYEVDNLPWSEETIAPDKFKQNLEA